MPNTDFGKLMVCPGVVMSEVTWININIHGKGGHSSKPQLAVDPV